MGLAEQGTEEARDGMRSLFGVLNTMHRDVGCSGLKQTSMLILFRAIMRPEESPSWAGQHLDSANQISRMQCWKISNRQQNAMTILGPCEPNVLPDKIKALPELHMSTLR